MLSWESGPLKEGGWPSKEGASSLELGGAPLPHSKGVEEEPADRGRPPALTHVPPCREEQREMVQVTASRVLLPSGWSVT